MKTIIQTMSSLVSNTDVTELGSSVPQNNLLQDAIADFQEFSSDYAAYFDNLITNQQFDSASTTADHLRYEYAQTLQTYWSSIEQVILQWQVKYYRDTLVKAHAQAAQYLKDLKLSLPGILVYFNKVSNIRYLPFTTIPIVGIPHPFSGEDQWSAIVHELGHYVYWNLGSNLGETQLLQKKLKEDVKKCLSDGGISEQQCKFVAPWLEEIFCDLIGTRINGSGFVNSSDAFISTQAGNKDELLINDGHHPPLILRPFIWYRALNAQPLVDPHPKLENIFNIADVANFQTFKIKASSPILSERNKIAATRTDLSDNDFESLGVGDLLSPVEKVVDFLNKRMDGILSSVSGGERKKSAFQELLKSIDEEVQSQAKFKDQKVYEILLKPRALEEGYYHTHGIQLIHGWHESTTHRH